ncbi:MAG: glycosyltransferase family 2 protein [Chlamydiia bacterium]|nr:glycosyltransferase family 2 protein [Chlamydiia bacterium]
MKSYTFPHSVIIAGVVRNCAKYLPQLLKKLEGIGNCFDKSHLIFVENDSTDSTLKVLKEWEQGKSNREVIALEPVETMLARRTGRLAFARNRYLERIENDPELSKYDYLLVTDMDDASQGLTPESIAACFEYPITDWEVMTANQTHLYYDIWTLRHPIWCPGDCFVEINGRPDFITKDFLDHIAVGARMISIPTNRGLIPVDSAFGGAALYRLSFVKGCKYKGLYRKQTEVCEHVALNKQLREKGARIFINPRMINSDGVSWHAFHTAPPSVHIPPARCANASINSPIASSIKFSVSIQNELR